jgi:hypothetical protein
MKAALDRSHRVVVSLPPGEPLRLVALSRTGEPLIEVQLAPQRVLELVRDLSEAMLRRVKAAGHDPVAWR